MEDFNISIMNMDIRRTKADLKSLKLHINYKVDDIICSKIFKIIVGGFFSAQNEKKFDLLIFINHRIRQRIKTHQDFCTTRSSVHQALIFRWIFQQRLSYRYYYHIDKEQSKVLGRRHHPFLSFQQDLGNLGCCYICLKTQF